MLIEGLIPHRCHHALRGEASHVARPSLNPSVLRAARPRAHLIAHREQGDSLATASAQRM